jgi:hypothetical protein
MAARHELQLGESRQLRTLPELVQVATGELGTPRAVYGISGALRGRGLSAVRSCTSAASSLRLVTLALEKMDLRWSVRASRS